MSEQPVTLLPAGPNVITPNDSSRFPALSVCGGMRPATPKTYDHRQSKRRFRVRGKRKRVTTC